MNIAHLLPYSARFPLSKHNGRYEWALRLARIQAAAGHNVTIYAGPESTDQSSIVWKSHHKNLGDKTKNNTVLIKMALSDQHDIYHSHFDFLHYLLADNTDKPIVYTQHWFPDQKISQAAKSNKNKNVIAVPSSKMMASQNEKLNILSAGIIRQGIDLNLFQPTPDQQISDRLIFVGRIAPWKGVLEAVEIAKKTNQKLDIVGKLNQTEQAYWRSIEPYIDGHNIRYLGPKDQTEIIQLLSSAKALIFPSQAPEAAPQVPIETQACGTPVILSDVGATDEWVDDGKSGFISKSTEDYIDAISKIDGIDRRYCREFAQQFDINIMIDKYYKLYRQLTSG